MELANDFVAADRCTLEKRTGLHKREVAAIDDVRNLSHN
jgi:hypothetical protein